MAGSTFGTLFTVVTFGESHGPAVGCVVDGCPAGLSLDVKAIARELARRRSGGEGPAPSGRKEADEPEILSGVFEGKTLGTPIAIIIRNTDQRPGDYDGLRDLYRPGHADWTWEAKYGLRDHRGGGRSSGRETAARVAAGAVAGVFLASYGISVRGWVSSIAGIKIPSPGQAGFDGGEAEKNPFRIPCGEYVPRVNAALEELRQEGDSAGGEVFCSVTGLPPGLGEPVFDKLDARIAAAMLSIGAARAVAFGAGFAVSAMKGSENNDAPFAAKDPGADHTERSFQAEHGGAAGALPPGVPELSFRTNNSGGVLGGISSGMPLEFTVAFKPTASIRKRQETADRNGAARELVIEGRHDVCIAPRAVPVVQAMASLVIADFILMQRCGR
ncbi:MAG: chorismate synthase [Treponema sp.]|jgi:chorismate synthase|nr:chorismate synthase [Treponema sp.]